MSMKVTVLLSSGDEDEWEDVADAIPSDGALYVVSLPDIFKPTDRTFSVTEEVKVGHRERSPMVMGIPHFEDKTTVYKLEALYAPGMWMKVEFE